MFSPLAKGNGSWDGHFEEEVVSHFFLELVKDTVYSPVSQDSVI